MKEVAENREQQEKRQWECGWEAHEALQRDRMSRLPLSEKIQWLEEAQRMVHSLQASRSSLADPENPRGD